MLELRTTFEAFFGKTVPYKAVTEFCTSKLNPRDISQEVMMELAWEEELSVGNAMIDTEHQNLIIVANNVEHAIRAKDSDALSRAFRLLEDHMRIHFTNEEKIAQAVNFPFTNNKLEHYYMLKLLQHMRDELEAKNGILSEDATEHFSHFLSDFITEHILREDMLMKPVLQTYPYDFKPD